MLTAFELVFYVERANESSMGLNVLANGAVVFASNDLDAGTHTVTFEATTPALLAFVLSNRNDHDTVCDKEGNIVQNKHVQLQSIKLDGIYIDGYKLDTVIHSPGHSVFWNFNGTVTLDINSNDPAVWFIDHKQLW